MPRKIDHQAIHIARRYLETRGYAVENVSRSPKRESYDLIAKRNAENLRIAVKACTHPWNIPDLHARELDTERRPIADFLYVVYLTSGQDPKLCIIPREAIKPEFIIPKQRYRISEKLKKEALLKQFLRAL